MSIFILVLAVSAFAHGQIGLGAGCLTALVLYLFIQEIRETRHGSQ